VASVGTDHALQAEMTALENAWFEALRVQDWDGARGFMHEDFSITTAGWLDAPADAKDWLKHLAGRYRLDAFDYDDVRVRRYGDVAVVQCRSHQSGTILDTGEPWSESFRYTDVWVLDSGAWRIAARQATMRPRAS
jgi:ketosteroid isomerase-like protein